MPDFQKRSVLPEKMDEPGVPEKEITQALEELEIVNRFLGGYRVTLNALKKTLPHDRAITIMDLGCGSGDMLRKIAQWASANKKEVKLIGVDRNPFIIEFAIKKSKEFKNISYKKLNIWDNELMNEKPDVIINSLFCHHFDDSELVKLIERMYHLTNETIIINDLHRSCIAYYSIKAITSVFSKSYLVKYDGPLSVARALTRTEWQNILHKAGIHRFQIKWMWAWRWQIIIGKHE